ncbi:MAG: heme exporter protein CcmB [Candidatus Poribacteria bacterium]|nr:heme exporter protein CcmB [Candidatus Poribacteria bacterium]
MRFPFRQIGALIRKDLGLQFRSKETLALIFVFSVLVVLIFAFAFGPIFPEKVERGKLTASVLWTAFVFAGIITLNRSFAIERAHAALQGIRLTGVDAGNLYLSKVISNVVFLFLLEIVITPIALQFLDLLDVATVSILLKLFGVLSIGTLGFCAVGVLLAGMSTSANGGESLLSVILFPLVIPIIMGGAKCTVSLLVTGGLANKFWLQLLIGYSLVFLASAYLLADAVIEE